jgi:hypothetical protein
MESIFISREHHGQREWKNDGPENIYQIDIRALALRK